MALINSGTLETLYVSFNGAFQAGYGQAGTAELDRIAMTVPSQTKQEEYGWLGQAHDLREFDGERVLRGIREHGYVIRNRTFESTLEVARDDISDDNLSVYRPLFMRLGESAARHPIQLVMEAVRDGFTGLCYDGKAFFASDHEAGDGRTQSNTGGGNGTGWYLLDLRHMIKPFIFQRREDYMLVRMDEPTDEAAFMRRAFRYGVDGRCNVGYGLWQYAYGSKQALTETNYRTAREAMMEYRGDRGALMGVMPTHLLVPPGLEHEALELLKAERQADGATNVYHESVELIMSPWLAA